jgi:hypothetical protein
VLKGSRSALLRLRAANALGLLIRHAATIPTSLAGAGEPPRPAARLAGRAVLTRSCRKGSGT